MLSNLFYIKGELLKVTILLHCSSQLLADIREALIKDTQERKMNPNQAHNGVANEGNQDALTFRYGIATPILALAH
jgi:hypothetical protein